MLTAIKGTYGNGRIILHETPPPVEEGAEVVVTFLRDSGLRTIKPEKPNVVGAQGVRFGSSFGKVGLPETFNGPLYDLNEYM